MDWACLLEKRGFPWGLRSNYLVPVGCVPVVPIDKKSLSLKVYQSINLSVINKGVSFFQFLLSYYYNLLNIN